MKRFDVSVEFLRDTPRKPGAHRLGYVYALGTLAVCMRGTSYKGVPIHQDSDLLVYCED